MALIERALATEFAATATLSTGLVSTAAIAAVVAPSQPAAQLLLFSGAVSLLIFILMRAAGGTGGGYLNPIVCAAAGLRGGARYEWVPATALFLLVQLAGAASGGWLADLAVASTHLPQGKTVPQLSGYAAEAGAGALLAVIAYLGPAAKRPILIGVFSGVLCVSTGSLSFGNPAMTVASMLAGIGSDGEAGNFAMRALAQLLGAAVALGAMVGLFSGHAEPDSDHN